MLMDEVMFMAFAMEEDDYDRRVRECAREIEQGYNIEMALEYYDVELADVDEAIRYHI